MKLTEEDWGNVFKIRCMTKQGRRISDEERALIDQAYTENRDRYRAMEDDVFNATVPFGSTVRK